MSRSLMYALVLPLLAAECWAQFIAHDWQLTTVFAVLALGVLAVRHLLGPAEDESECSPACPKCRESASLDANAADDQATMQIQKGK